MSKSKKIKTLTISALMMTSVSASTIGSFAAVTHDQTATIKANGLQDNTKGDIYKIIDVNWENGQPKFPQYKWATEIQEWVRTNFPTYIAEDGSVTDKFDDKLSDTGTLDGDRNPEDKGAYTFYDALSKAIKSNAVTLKGEEFTAASKVATIANKQMGGYLLLFKNDTRVYRPSVVKVYPTESGNDWILAPEFDVTIKSTEVPIVKTVDKKDGSIGDKFNYTIDATIPVYPKGTRNKMFNVYDKIDNSLTIDNSTIAVKGVKSDGSKEALTVSDAYELLGKGVNHTDANFGLKFDYEKIKKYEKVEITYSATLNRNAKIGESNQNIAMVDYNNNPYSDKDGDPANPDKTAITPPTDANVMVYGLDLSKVDEKKAPLAGAEFSIQNNAGQTIKLVKVSDGEYTVSDKLTTPSAETTVDNAAVSAGGKLLIKGLALGQYKVLEVKAPNGYVKLQNPLTIDIKDANRDGVVDENASTSKGFIALTVENSKGFTWPVTGGAGTMLFTAGGTLVVTAGIYMAARKKKEDK